MSPLANVGCVCKLRIEINLLLLMCHILQKWHCNVFVESIYKK